MTDADGYVIVGVELDTDQFDDDVQDMEKSSKLKSFFDKISQRFKGMFMNVSKITSKLSDGLGKIGQKIVKIGGLAIKTMAKVLLSATQFGLSFGVALGAIGLLIAGLAIIAEALKKVANEHSELKTQFQYIIFAIKTALEPAINWVADKLAKIIEFLLKILQYAMALANILAGRDLFAKADAEAFSKYLKQSEKSSKKTANNAAKIRKQLMGFDEMNILQDNVSGGGGTAKDELPLIPSIDDEQKVIQDYQTMWNELYNIGYREAYRNFTGSGSPWGIMQFGIFEIIQGIQKQFTGLGTSIGGVFKIIKGIALRDWKEIWNGAKELITGVGTSFIGLGETIKGVFDTIFGVGYGLGASLRDFINEKVIGGIANKLNVSTKTIETILRWIFNFPIELGKATANNIKTKIKGIAEDIEWLKGRLLENFKEGFWKGLINTFIDIFNRAIERINSKFTIKINDDVASLLQAIGINAKSGSYSLLKLKPIDRLARGGIINYPGKGVAVGGESGAEGVIPLTDSQQMALLGESIGKYITINATLINEMNGRVISREMKKIESESAFASNR